MASLNREQRKTLESTVIQARKTAEAGSRKALDQLAVSHHEAWSTLSPPERALRARLRERGKQLGDARDERRATQAIEKLALECAYEQWHRMLFARFLAECGVLVEPVSGVAISIDECKELARERNTDWLVLACSYAQRMLPQIFRSDDPVLEISLPPEYRHALEELLAALPGEVFLADDSLGWVYQFWQTEQRKQINDSDFPIGPQELPAVTQLFTEDYMVLFLLENTLGAWWAHRYLQQHPELSRTAPDEDHLRRSCSLPDYAWTYLRFVHNDGGDWRPATSPFESWPQQARDIRLLDPCMGSGHFLVFALPILAALRRVEENVTLEEAFVAALTENLFGLEIDQRCAQLAAFNLALTTWKRTGWRPLPGLNLACSGIAPHSKRQEWTRLAGSDQEARLGMEALHGLFGDAAVLGSLIEPKSLSGDLLSKGYSSLTAPLNSALQSEASSPATHELAVSAQGMKRAAEILSESFTLVATNVPFLARAKQVPRLQNYCAGAFPRAKSDLATVFFERSFRFLKPGGTIAFVSPRIWLTYTAYYEGLRNYVVKDTELGVIAALGKSAFETIGGEIVDVALLVVSRNTPSGQHRLHLLDASIPDTPRGKAAGLRDNALIEVTQADFRNTPGKAFIRPSARQVTLLKDVADCYEGLSRGDVRRFDRCFWELAEVDGSKWALLINSGTCDGAFSGADLVFRWDGGAGPLAASNGARVQGQPAWGKPGVFVSRTHLRTCLTLGHIHAQNGVAIVPREPALLDAIFAFCSSEEYRAAVARLNQKLIKPTGVLAQVPFDASHWTANAAPVASGAPSSASPTQIYFSGHIPSSDDPLHVAVCRLVGYRWPEETRPRRGSSILPPTTCAPGVQDGIACLSALRGDTGAGARLLELLAATYGAEWSPQQLQTLLHRTGGQATDIDSWLRNEFAGQHNVLFQQHPLVWQIWDGRADGFSALVSYHHLAAPHGRGLETLQKLTYTYLGDWIARQTVDQRAGLEGADARLAAAQHLKAVLEAIAEGEPPYDIFVRWKPLREQPVGWHPDLADGIFCNIRPFATARALRSGQREPSILRQPPTFSWKRDLGREPQRDVSEYPWLWDWDHKALDFTGGRLFDGIRWNDPHYSRTLKLEARRIRGL